jgi:hypothetical protein
MATKIKTVLEFVFKADQMMEICKSGQDILVTSYLEEVLTQGNQKVGAMRVKAKSMPPKPENVTTIAPQQADGTIYGCPVPPCVEE